MLSLHIFLAAAFVLGSIVDIEAKKSSNLLRHQVALRDVDGRNLQAGPQHPDLTIISTDGGTIAASAEFFQGGNRYIRVFKDDCITKFDPDVDFTVGGSSSTDSGWTENGSAGDTVNFVIPLKHLNGHLDNTDAGKVDVCIQLETVNTLSNTKVPVTLDLTHSATAVSVEAKQPDAVFLAGVDVITQVNAWICAGNDSDPAFTDTKIDTLEVPGKIYVCIEVSDGYAIRSGKLTADAAQTVGDDKIIDNYMNTAVLAAGVTGQYNEEDTIQVLKPNLVRVSIMGDRNWAPVLSSDTLTITVDAYFEPTAGRRLASSRRLAKFQPGSLRIKNAKEQKFASAFTTVQLRAAPDTGPAITSGVNSDGTTPTNESKTNIGAIAGSACAGALVVGAVAFLLVTRKRRQNEEANENEKANTDKVPLESTDMASLDSTTRSSFSSNSGGSHDTSRSSVSKPKISGNPNARVPPRRPPQGSPRGPPRRPPQGSPRGPPRRNNSGIHTGAPRPHCPNNPSRRTDQGPPRRSSNRPRGPVPATGGRHAPPRRQSGNAPGPLRGNHRPKTPTLH